MMGSEPHQPHIVRLDKRAVVFICSPLRGDVENNIKLAEGYCRKAVERGYLPICPHIYFTRFLNDHVEAEREAGIDMGLTLLALCQEIWVIGTPSEGMEKEIMRAVELGIRVRVWHQWNGKLHEVK